MPSNSICICMYMCTCIVGAGRWSSIHFSSPEFPPFSYKHIPRERETHIQTIICVDTEGSHSVNPLDVMSSKDLSYFVILRITKPL